MFPIRDENPSKRLPLVTITLIVLNVLGFAYELMIPLPELEKLVRTYGLVPARYTNDWRQWLSDPRAVSAWLTSMFLHGGILHLLGNIWTLWIFGDNVEDKLGRFKYLLFYLLCGIAAGVGQIAVDRSSTVPMIGASGAIAGMMGAYLLFFPKARVLVLIPILFWPLFVKWPAIVFMGLWIFIQYFNGKMALADPTQFAGVAWWAHIGGFVTGMLMGPFMALLGDGDGPGNEEDR